MSYSSLFGCNCFTYLFFWSIKLLIYKETFFELPSAPVSKVPLQNSSYVNEFDLHENKHVGEYTSSEWFHT